jgi:putative endonuclease
MNDWYVYLAECSDNSFYCGITTNVEKRISTHNEKKGAKYTASRVPITLIDYARVRTRSEALQLEAFIKKLPRLMKPRGIALFRKLIT